MFIIDNIIFLQPPTHKIVIFSRCSTATPGSHLICLRHCCATWKFFFPAHHSHFTDHSVLLLPILARCLLYVRMMLKAEHGTTGKIFILQPPNAIKNSMRVAVKGFLFYYSQSSENNFFWWKERTKRKESEKKCFNLPSSVNFFLYLDLMLMNCCH